MRRLCLRFALLVLVAAESVAASDTDSWMGEPLSAYLDALNRAGEKIVYTSDLVTGSMLLETEPDSDNPAAALADLLAPFGLAARPGPSGSLLIVRGDLPPERTPAAAAVIEPKVPIPEIVVTSSLHRLEYADGTTHTYLDRELATRMPTTADEAVRLTSRLPGTANGGVSARNHIRGGELNEVLFLFDGVRLYEPYHLKDFQTIATIVNSSVIGGMDFYTGAYPAHYGDRMSGVLAIDMLEPDLSWQTELALSFFNASVQSSGILGDEGQGEWLLSARRGNLDLVADVIDPEFGSPSYHDVLGHLGWNFGARAEISANVLVSDDRITLNDVDRGESAGASYTNHVGWLKWRAAWTQTLSSETLFASSDITNRRNGTLALPGIVSGRLNEYREFNVLQLRQDWRWVPADDWMLRFGLDLKDLDAQYSFDSERTISAPFDTILDNETSTSRDFERAPAGRQYATYGELRWRFARRWTADIGLRWDRQTYTSAEDDRQYSPRLSVLYQPGEATEIRLGWGQFYQAQEINELQLPDGIENFFPAQRAEHFVLNIQHAFRGGLDASLSIYRKSFRALRPRFENVFNSLTLLPEIQFDRVLIDPLGAEAIGIELLLTQGTADEDLLWWVGYSWAETEDEMRDGQVKRSWDQTHTLKAGASFRWGRWDFSAAAEVHTGWPGTFMTGENIINPDGSTGLLLDVTGRNSVRYSVFHALDVRVSRDIEVKRGELTAFLEVSNLYDRANPCCVEYSLAADGSLASREAQWLPLVPSLGVIWRF